MIAIPAVRLKSNFDYLMTDEVMIVAAKDHPVMEYVHRNIEADGSTSQPWVSLADAARFEFIFGAPKTMLGRIARREFPQKKSLRNFLEHQLQRWIRCSHGKGGRCSFLYLPHLYCSG